MTSATNFSKTHNSFWSTYAPALENTVRTTNIGGTERFNTPLISKSLASRNYIVNETAFFCVTLLHESDPNTCIDMAFELAVQRLRNLPGVPETLSPLSQTERDDVSELKKRAQLGFASFGVRLDKTHFVAPVPGCGTIDNCFSDAISKDVLVEVKSGDRPFRSIDFRQVLTYHCLLQAAERPEVERYLLINPRLGVGIMGSFDQLIFDVSGMSKWEFVTNFLASVTTIGPSR